MYPPSPRRERCRAAGEEGSKGETTSIRSPPMGTTIQISSTRVRVELWVEGDIPKMFVNPHCSRAKSSKITSVPIICVCYHSALLNSDSRRIGGPKGAWLSSDLQLPMQFVEGV